MELKVWVEGIQRIVCGVTDKTTCQDVVYALAHATGRTGRFTLIERWRNNERLLAPQENPLKVLMKWGEYSTDVQFILQRTPLEKETSSPSDAKPWAKHGPESKNVKRDNVGIVKGVPQQRDSNSKSEPGNFLTKTCDQEKPGGSHREGISTGSAQFCSPVDGPSPSQLPLGLPPYRDPPRPSSPWDKSPIRPPPPYREPPPVKQRTIPPRTMAGNSFDRDEDARTPSPEEMKNSRFAEVRSPTPTPRRHLLKEFKSHSAGEKDSFPGGSPSKSPRYRELLDYVNSQREHLSYQQAEITQYDAEIQYWEVKAREQQKYFDQISQETLRLEALNCTHEQEVRELHQIEEEMKLSSQRERTLQSELTLLRSKLANCETQLLQCKNKIRILMEEVSEEQRLLSEQEMLEISHHGDEDSSLGLQEEIHKKQMEYTELSASSQDLETQIVNLEEAIVEKKQQLEVLLGEMKQMNLESLSFLPLAEEVQHLVDGGSIQKRRMVGSPRQLETAAPTPKNPQGVWV